VRPRAYTLLALRLAAAEAGALVGLGYCAPMAALLAPSPPLPLAGPPAADVAELARLMGRDPREVDAEVFAVRAKAWRERGELVSHEDAVRAHGVGCAFADVGMGREWPEEAR
jgi:hypothetical protein